MPRDQALRQLTAALLAAGLLGGAAQANAQENPAEQRNTPVAIYGMPMVEPVPKPPVSNAPSLDGLESAVDELLTYADSPEGLEEQRRDPGFKKLIQELRAAKASIQRRRAK
jgi:hypothetical protein